MAHKRYSDSSDYYLHSMLPISQYENSSLHYVKTGFGVCPVLYPVGFRHLLPSAKDRNAKNLSFIISLCLHSMVLRHWNNFIIIPARCTKLHHQQGQLQEV
jgi:hypothetical protein